MYTRVNVSRGSWISMVNWSILTNLKQRFVYLWWRFMILITQSVRPIHGETHAASTTRFYRLRHYQWSFGLPIVFNHSSLSLSTICPSVHLMTVSIWLSLFRCIHACTPWLKYVNGWYSSDKVTPLPSLTQSSAMIFLGMMSLEWPPGSMTIA